VRIEQGFKTYKVKENFVQKPTHLSPFRGAQREREREGCVRDTYIVGSRERRVEEEKLGASKTPKVSCSFKLR
jgi:hypothetical protein